ncbi:MAG: hypothetical protein ACD_62C00226G0001 [uncultured bacterium]|nr:MAG: hypothetical protein ACD_62C00226G0001 [uncultured bacterium]
MMLNCSVFYIYSFESMLSTKNNKYIFLQNIFCNLGKCHSPWERQTHTTY